MSEYSSSVLEEYSDISNHNLEDIALQQADLLATKHNLIVHVQENADFSISNLLHIFVDDYSVTVVKTQLNRDTEHENNVVIQKIKIQYSQFDQFEHLSNDYRSTLKMILRVL
jgi:hypothetical protein